MDEREREQIVEALVERLRIEGVPEGTWLVDITATRQALRDAFGVADDLLGRLQDALVDALRP